MAKALKTAALVVGGAALVLTGVGAVAGVALGFGAAAGAAALTTGLIGVSAGTLFAVAAGLSLGASLLAPKPKAPQVSPATTDRLNASIVLRALRTFVFGRTAMATDIRDQEFSVDQAYLHRWIVCASHKVQSVEELWLDDKQAWTSAGGVTGDFAGYLDVTPVLEGSAANAINTGPRMGSTRRYTGCAYLYLRFRLTGTSSKATSPFASAVPSRTTIVGKGAAVYDPRLDSTAGGSGPQRANDQTTWAWSDGASRNPALQLLTYLLGWRIQNPTTGAWKLAVGKGIPAARIDLASFITAANLCDESVAKAAGGTEPRYRSDGIFSEGDDLSVVLDSFKAAMNAVLDDVDGKIRVTVLHNDLASPIGALTAADVLGEFTWTQTPPLPDSFNVVRGGYTDPSSTSLYQLVDYPEVAIASPDGIERVTTVNLPLVQSASQAQRLAKMRLQRALYGGTFQAVFQATAWKFQKGDVVTLTFPALGWSAKLFRIVDMTVQVDGTVPMMLREEATAIYAWDASDAAPVVGAAPTTYNAVLSPLVQGIGDAATTAAWPNVTDPAGTRPANNATRNQVTYSTTAPASPVNGDIWVDLNGAYAVFKLRNGGVWQVGATALAAYNDLTGRPIALADINTTESAKLAGVEQNADVTPVRVTGPTATTIAYDYTGAAKAGQLPIDILFKAATAAGVDVTTAAAWSAVLKSGGATFTIGAASGVLNVTACSADATIEVTATYSGKAGKATTAIQRMVDAPPVSSGGSGGGGGGGGGSAGTSASTSAISPTTSATYGAPNAPVLTVKAGSAGSVSLTFPGEFKRTTSGSSDAHGKWQKSAAGAGVWSDVAAEIASYSGAEKIGGTEPYNQAGSISVNQTATGLTSGSDYDFRLLLRNDSAVTCNWTGTAAAVAS